MADNDFRFDAVAGLKETESQKQVKKDIKSFLSNIKIPLIGTLSSKTKAQLMKDIASLNGVVNLTGKVDSKGVASSLQQATTQVQKQVNAKPIEVSFAVKKEKLVNDIKLLAQQNSKLFKDTDMSIKYNSLLDDASMARNSVELSALRTQLGSLRSELKITGNAGLTFGDSLKKSLSKVMGLFGNFNIIMQFRQQLHNAWIEAEELDKSMTDLSRVNAEITRSGFPDYLDKVIDKTKLLAVATKDYIDAVTTFSRAGYNLADSETLADMAVQLEKVGDMSAVDASKALLAGLQGYAEIDGYGMDQLTEKAQALNDKIDKIGNTASLTQKEAAEGIQAVGSVMSDANTSIDEFLALLGAGNRAVQDSDKVALAIRTSALRIRGCTTELEEMGETTDDVIESTSTLAEKIKALTNIDGSGGVNILEEDEETFRSIYDIYNDISKVYDKMSDTDASALLDLIAGKNRSNQISAILQNMSEANELLESSLSAAGTASAEYEIYLSSAEAASERFGVAMTETYSNIISGETVKGLENAGAAVLNFANSWGIVEGVLKGFLTLGILKGVTTLTVAFKNSALQISNYGSALDAVKKVSVHAQGTEDYARAMDLLKSSCVNLTDAQLKQVLANRNLEESQLIEILQLDTLEKEQTQARLAQLGLIQTTETQTVAQGAATVSTFSLSAAIKGLGTSIKLAFMSNPIGIIIMGISVAIGVLTAGISKLKQKQEEARQAMQEAKQEYQDLTSEVANLNEELETTRERLKELDAIGYNNLSLVEQEEYDRLKATNNELEREFRIKEALAKVKAKEVADNARNTLSKRTQTSLEKVEYGSEGVALETTVDIVESANEYINLAEKQRQSLEETKQALEDYENTYIGTAEEMVQDKSWQKLNDNVEKAENALSDTERTISEKYESIEEDAEGLVDSFGNVVSGCEEMYQRVEDLKNRTDEYFNLAAGIQDETKEMASAVSTALKALEINTQTLFSKLAEGKESLDQFQSSVKLAADAYTTLLSGNYSSTELLDSIQAINQAVTDMGGSLDWEFINSQSTMDSLELLGDAIQYISQKYAESILSGAGIDVNSEFGQMLTNIIQEAYEAEAAFEGMNSQLDNLQSSYQTLTGILESYNETGHISLDNLQSLLTADENLIAMLEVENGQLVLNQAAYENLVAVQLLEFKTKLSDAAAAEIETLAKQKAEQATNQNADASQNAVEKLDAETAAFNRNTSAAIANAVTKAEESGVSEAEIQSIFNKYTEIWNSAMDNYNVDFDGFMSGGKSAASKAGGEAADAYLDAFQKEYDHLKDLLGRGEISEAQYLSRLRALYTKYFKDRKEYLDEFKKYESEYLSGMIELHNKALSGISTLLNRKINAANDAKDAAISALEEEKEAAAEAYQAQIDAIEEEKDAIDELIDEKNKKIDAINEEIDAIERAAETRKKNIDLQQQEYNLQKMLNQKTSMVYKDGQFVFETDTTGIRDAREKVTEAKEALQIDSLKNEISLIQKEIDLLEEKKDALTKEQEAIQKLLDESNNYYDNLIKQQEKYFDSMIKGMEQQKSRWEELAEVKEIAEAFSYIQQVFGDLGYTVEDVLNGSDAAFEDFKAQYISLISDVNNNSDFTDGLVYATGVAKENLGSFLEKTKETGAGIDELVSKGTVLNTVAEGMDGLATSASDANANITETATSVGNVVSNVGDLTTNLSEVNSLVSEEQTAFNNLKQKIDEVIEAINQKTEAIQEEQKAVGIATSSEMADFLLLKEKILEVKETLESLGTQDEGLINNIATAISSLNDIKLEDGIIGQFTQLKAAIDSVSSAISGGGESSGGEGQGGGSGKGGESGGSGSKGSEGGSGGNSLAGAIESMGKTANEVIGEPDAEGDGTVIGEFGSLETAVSDVTTAIGSGDTEGCEGSGGASGNENDGNLISSIIDLGETTEETLGEPGGDGVIGKFEQFKEPIAEADEHVHSISDGLAAIDGQTVECTIKINIDSDSFPAYASGTALGAMNLESAEYNAKYTGNAHVSGTANVSGNWGVRKPGKSLVGEIGQEIWVHSADGTFETVGDNGPEWIKTEKGDLIFNHLQTKELLDKGNIVKTGKAYANGNIQYSDGTVIRANGDVLEPLQPGDKMYDMLQKFNAYMDSIDNNVEKLSSHITYEHSKQINEVVNQITNSSVVNNNRNVQQPVINGGINITCPGVTSKEVAQQVVVEVDRIFNGMHLEADQRSRMR